LTLEEEQQLINRIKKDPASNHPGIGYSIVYVEKPHSPKGK